jgi:hypothetical protein
MASRNRLREKRKAERRANSTPADKNAMPADAMEAYDFIEQQEAAHIHCGCWPGWCCYDFCPGGRR